jgi:hypothetical protein
VIIMLAQAAVGLIEAFFVAVSRSMASARAWPAPASAWQSRMDPQIQPELRGAAEVAREPDGGIGSDTSARSTTMSPMGDGLRPLMRNGW